MSTHCPESDTIHCAIDDGYGIGRTATHRWRVQEQLMTDAGSPGGDRRPDVEIIPPDGNRTRAGRAQSRIWISIGTSRGERPRGVSGLFGVIVAILVVTFVTAVVLML